MSRQPYAAARTISPKLHDYFARRLTEAASHGKQQLAPLPDVETIEAIVDAALG